MRLLCVVIFYCLSSCKADSVQQIVFKIDSIKKISSTTNLKETLLISFKDSLRLDTALLNSNEGNLTNRILLIKEANSEDYWKYIIPVLTLLLGIAVNKGLDYFSERKRIKKVGKSMMYPKIRTGS